MIDLSKISSDGIELMKKEFGVTEEEIEKCDKKAWNELRIKCFDIECAELDAEGECSDKGEVAADVVDLLYADVQAE